MYFITNNKIHRFNELYRVHGFSPETKEQQDVKVKTRKPLSCLTLLWHLAFCFTVHKPPVVCVEEEKKKKKKKKNGKGKIFINIALVFRRWNTNAKGSETLIAMLLIFPRCSQEYVTISTIKCLRVRPVVCVRGYVCVCTCSFCPSRDMIIVCCDIVMKPSGPLKLISLPLSVCR